TTKNISSIQQRLIKSATDIALDNPHDILFQHTMLCQTGLPYRNQKGLRRWERNNGRVSLEIEAGRALHPETEQYVDVPLPFGIKARLVLIHLNSQAVKTGSPVIEVENSLTAFVKSLLKRDPNGREVRDFKNQLSALSTATIRLSILEEHRAVQINTHIITAFDIWFPKNPNQRVLWPSTVRLSQEYFDTLVKHAIPLDERGDLMAAYYKRLTGDDEIAQAECARAWALWEFSGLSLWPDPKRHADLDSDQFTLAFARIECHYFVNGGFFDPDDQIIQNLHKIKHIPAVLIQGRYDMCTPVRTAWDVHKAWPEADFRLVGDAGHASSEPGIVHELICATDRFAVSVSKPQ
ncbi:MAG: hypothetical protein IIC12_00825, partial [Proteobacteria bacterium]|nr:hypothetical protein [Pseudomonadota bacterium]